MSLNSCNLCGCKNSKNCLKIRQYELLRCQSCGHVYLSEAAEKCKEIKYEQEYFTSKTNNVEINKRLLKEDKKRFDRIISEVYKYKNNGRWLDIGCGLGGVLSAAKEQGYITTGYDVSEYAVSQIKKIYKIPAFTGDIKKNIKNNSFDIISLIHVLEHIPDPVNYLINDVIPFLKSDGILFVEVPNYGSLRAKVRGKEWNKLALPAHVNQFTWKTLKYALVKSGFKPKTIFTVDDIGKIIVDVDNSKIIQQVRPLVRLIKPARNIVRKLYFGELGSKLHTALLKYIQDKRMGENLIIISEISK